MHPTLLTQSAELARLESELGYSFARPELLVQALAHRSQTYGLETDLRGSARPDNERLEFLGDAVLGLLVTEALYQTYPDWQEGELTQLRAQLVNRQHLARVAQSIGLGEHIRMSKDIERAGGRKNAYILANAMEAVLAAMFLDAGNAEPGKKPVKRPGRLKANEVRATIAIEGSLDAVRRFTRRHILGPKAEELAGELRSGSALGNFKSKLQEHLQATRAGMPVYLLRSASGPDHRKQFLAEVRVRTADGKVGAVLAVGEGISRKKAEQEAAKRALDLIAEQALAEEILVEEPAGV
jgi:ribonuclease-3